MKKWLFAAVLPLVLLLCACDVSRMGSLTDISRPYAGAYECEELSLGGRDMLGSFDYIRLELDGNGAFALSYKTALGGAGGYGGEYSVDSEQKTITFSASAAQRTVKRTFPLEEGAICMDMQLRGTLVHAVFRMP